jgi:anti-anti-sigma factor
MNIESTVENGATVLTVTGRVDTNTSPAFQDAIVDAYKTSPHLIIDFAGVDYLSSAGLRALLIGQKTATSKKAKFEMRNVRKSVFDIIKSVGFTKFITVS